MLNEQEIVEERRILEYISYLLEDFKISSKTNCLDRYHHNTSYADAHSVIKNGILTLEELNNRGIRKDSKEFLERMNNTLFHINGIKGVSLAVVGLKDLYYDEEEFDPLDTDNVDIIVSSNVQAYRNSENYGNEYISRQCIQAELFRAIDIRLLRYMENIRHNSKHSSVKELVLKYNGLIKMAIALKERQLDIPLREMSLEDGRMLDIDKVSQAKKITLIKEPNQEKKLLS